MKLILSNATNVPIYEQIKIQIKEGIAQGDLSANDALPSLRSIAKELKISVLTVTRAYTELEQEGFVKNIQGKGCFVLPKGDKLLQEQLLAELSEHIQSAIQLAQTANYPKKDLERLIKKIMEGLNYE